MRKEKQGIRGSRGSLTVECLLFMIPVMCAFFSLVNISRFVQAEVIIHHAVTQTAKQISVYSYILTKAAIADKLQATAKKSDKFKADTDKTVDDVKKFMDAVGGLGSDPNIVAQVENVVDTGETAYDSVTSYFSDPKALLSGLLSFAKAKGEQVVLTYVAGSIAKGCIRDSLNYITDDANDFLMDVGVIDGLEGLDFSESRWMSNSEGKGNVKIIVTYTMENLMFPQFNFGRHEYRMCASTSIW